MSLVSALNSALGGLAAAATRIEVAANSIAHADTVAFKTADHGNGRIASDALERSDISLDRELTAIMTSSLNFRANLRVIDSVGGLLDELLFLDR